MRNLAGVRRRVGLDSFDKTHAADLGGTMIVTHLYHSGFLVELPELTLLFDWYRTEVPGWGENEVRLRADKKLYVFVSHAHGDHFAPAIWDIALRSHGTDPTFIVDAEVADLAPKGIDLDVVSCEPETIYEIDDMVEVTTLESTDLGVAFLVEACGWTIYHAGDLSVWWWPERDLSLNEASEKNCRYFLEVIEGKHVDLAFLPITPRAGTEGDRGIELFMNTIGADVVVPMHYGDDREGALRLANSARLAPWRDRMRFDRRFEL